MPYGGAKRTGDTNRASPPNFTVPERQIRAAIPTAALVAALV